MRMQNCTSKNLQTEKRITARYRCIQWCVENIALSKIKPLLKPVANDYSV